MVVFVYTLCEESLQIKKFLYTHCYVGLVLNKMPKEVSKSPGLLSKLIGSGITLWPLRILIRKCIT